MPSFLCTPPRVARVSICPPAPARPTTRPPLSSHKTLDNAVNHLVYMKNMKALIESAPCSDALSCQSESLAFFNKKITSLELDIAKIPCYIYNLEIYEEHDNQDERTVMTFSTSKNVHDYIIAFLSDPSMGIYDMKSKPYEIPSSEKMDEMMDENSLEREILLIGDEFANNVKFYLGRVRVT